MILLSSIRFHSFLLLSMRGLFTLDRSYPFRRGGKCCRIFGSHPQEKHRSPLPSWLQDHWLPIYTKMASISSPRSSTQNYKIAKDSHNSRAHSSPSSSWPPHISPYTKAYHQRLISLSLSQHPPTCYGYYCGWCWWRLSRWWSGIRNVWRWVSLAWIFIWPSYIFYISLSSIIF